MFTRVQTLRHTLAPAQCRASVVDSLELYAAACGCLGDMTLKPRSTLRRTYHPATHPRTPGGVTSVVVPLSPASWEGSNPVRCTPCEACFKYPAAYSLPTLLVQEQAACSWGQEGLAVVLLKDKYARMLQGGTRIASKRKSWRKGGGPERHDWQAQHEAPLTSEMVMEDLRLPLRAYMQRGNVAGVLDVLRLIDYMGVSPISHAQRHVGHVAEVHSDLAMHVNRAWNGHPVVIVTVCIGSATTEISLEQASDVT